jgi:pimeloyl-ACP methyl ester carboxylesterase
MKEKSKCVILIPGIGGFPEFHQDLISNLCDGTCFEICTGPHGDYNSNPFLTLGQHVTHWSDFISSETEKVEREIHLIGVSFGAAIAISLPKRALRGIKTVTLVSPPYLPRYFRLVLRILGLFHDSITSNAVGKFLFWWSERKVDDAELLREQRKYLYDDYSLVYRRLWSRLHSLLDMPSLRESIQSSKFQKIGIIYAKNEYAYRNSPLINSPASFLTRKIELIVIPGDHSETIINSTHLVSAVKKSIRGFA